MEINDRILDHYKANSEDERLQTDTGILEFIRTKEIIARFCQSDRMKILDIGGGTGPYAFWLSALKHEAHLIDPVEKHIKIAKEKNATTDYPLKSVLVGDARYLKYPDNTFDIVLLLGPLYHLTEVKERAKAILEAKRVLKTKGFLFSAFISRFVSLRCLMALGLT